MQFEGTSYSGGKELTVSSHVSSLSPSYGNFRLCVCEGSNENCRYCSGTGRITTSFTPSKGPGPLATAGHNGLKKLGSTTTQLKRSKHSAEVLGSTVIPEKKTSSKAKLNELNRASFVYSLFGEGLCSNDQWLACNTCRISFTEQESTATLMKNIEAPGRMSERASNRISVHQIDIVMSKENSLAALLSGIQIKNSSLVDVWGTSKTETA
jgi:hypothetical protein